MKPIYVILMLFWLSLTVSVYGFHFENGGIPGSEAAWGAVLGRSVAFTIWPLIVLGISRLNTRLKKQAAVTPTIWMFAFWAFMVYFGYIHDLTK